MYRTLAKPLFRMSTSDFSNEKKAAHLLIKDFSFIQSQGARARCSQDSAVLWCEIIRPKLWDRRSPLSHWLCASSSSPDRVCLSVKSEWKKSHLAVRQKGVPLVLRHQPLNPPFQYVGRGRNTEWSRDPQVSPTQQVLLKCKKYSFIFTW